MDDGSQIFIPESFLDLFRRPNSHRLSEPHHHIAARYEFCEDLAQMLVSPTADRVAMLGLAPQDALERTWAGLQGLGSPAAPVAPEEGWWVLRRLAELMGWDDPGPPPSAP